MRAQEGRVGVGRDEVHVVVFYVAGGGCGHCGGGVW